MTQSLRILVVDDNPDVLKMFDEIFALEGHQVAVFNDGQSAIDAFDPQSFDIVITDLGMPDVTGWDVVRAIRAQRADMPIFIITAIGEYVDPDKVNQLGIQAVIRKPFRLAEMRALIAEHSATN